MSVKAMAFVWEHSEQKNTKLLMLLGIADHCDDEGKCFPGVKRLQLKTRLENYKSASRIICDLETAGEVTIVRRRGRSSIYYLTEFCEANGLSIPQMVDTIDDDDPPQNGGQGIPKTVDDPPPNGEQGIPKTVDDPPPNGGLESSVKSSVDPSVDPSIESSSIGDEDDLLDNELAMVLDVFGTLEKAESTLALSKALTVGWCDYALRLDDSQIKKSRAGYVFRMVRKKEIVPKSPPMPVESDVDKHKRLDKEFRAGFSDEEWEIYEAEEAARVAAKRYDVKKKAWLKKSERRWKKMLSDNNNRRLRMKRAVLNAERRVRAERLAVIQKEKDEDDRLEVDAMMARVKENRAKGLGEYNLSDTGGM